MTDEQLITKFRHDVDGVLPDAAAEWIVEAVFDPENVMDVAVLLDLTNPVAEATPHPQTRR
ncbi:hypothetical protein I1A62_23550 [Rhodococcus sp. USK10]|uniref:hypothetical protein n=1 Tax=Rhodococcus sp. USK10 TaxID=2789739 RepID=UPI001C5D7528|nr:hypothetical protein [Rhodococcus sp. USK10]QYB07238.1 hypothetical protein I1A62_23550 [Rhodococcus sp. USK10]